MGDEVENVDYNELVDKIIKDCGIQDLCDDVKKLSAELLEDRAITRQRFHTIMELINRVDTRLDQHMENQATAPIREVNELKSWLKDYMDNYVIKTNEKLNSSEEKIKRHESEIFGNGKKALRVEIESLKTKASLTLWLVGILLTGSGLSVVGLMVWRFVFGG